MTRVLLALLVISLMSTAPTGGQAAEPDAPGTYARIFIDLLAELDACGSTASPSTPASCLDIVWRPADVTRDGFLSAAEINRLLRIVGAGFAYQNYRDETRAQPTQPQNAPLTPPPENQEFPAAVGFAMLGPLITSLLLANLDCDDDGLLSRAEALQDTEWENVVASFESERDRLPARALEAYSLLQQLLGDRAGSLAKPKIELSPRNPPPPQQANQPPVQARPSPAPANTDIEMIRRQLHECWILPDDVAIVGVAGARIRVRFNRDGSLNGPPEVVEGFGGTGIATGALRKLEDSAISSILRCTPLIRLPVNPDGWRDAEYIFDPKDIPG